jgi:adenosylmethionine-8-amino-7-oxononanoate aminotransferase
MFAMERFGFLPDIVVMAKGLTSGYAPLGALATGKKVTRGIPDKAFLIPGYTYTGHPVSCAAALENLKILKSENLAQNAKERGLQLESLLREKVGDHPCVGDIRCEGLLCCIELVRNRETREPFSHDEGISDMLARHFLSHGVYVRLVEGYIHIGPPLIVTKDEISWLVERVVEALEELQKKVAP